MTTTAPPAITPFRLFPVQVVRVEQLCVARALSFGHRPALRTPTVRAARPHARVRSTSTWRGSGPA
ncbi:MAG: hypothetical protein ACOH17_15545 [Cellulomonas sp.]